MRQKLKGTEVVSCTVIVLVELEKREHVVAELDEAWVRCPAVRLAADANLALRVDDEDA